MRSFENYRKFARQDLGDSFLGYEVGDSAKRELFSKILSGKTSKREKLRAAFCLARELFPQSLSRENFLKKNSDLPFDDSKFNFQEKIGSGGESEVFLLESREGDLKSYAIKLDKEGLERGLSPLDRAREIKEAYLKIKSIYQSIPGLIPEELFLVANDPASGQNTVVSVQQFFSGEVKDVFRGFEQQELIDILKTNPDLEKKFSEFCRITVEHYEKSGEMVDLLGENNLSLTKSGDVLELVLLDSHKIHSDATLSPDSKRRQEKIFALMKDFLDKNKHSEAA